MEISELSEMHNIPLKIIIDFFSSQEKYAYIGKPLSESQIVLFLANLANLKGTIHNSIITEQSISKIDLDAIDSSTRPVRPAKRIDQKSGTASSPSSRI